MHSSPNESAVNPTVFEKFLEPVTAAIEHQEQNRSPHHNERLTYLEFFRMLIYYVVSGIPSIALFLNTYLRKGLVPAELGLHSVPRSTFNDAFERFSPDLFRSVFLFLLSSLTFQQIPELASLGVFCCVDGSLFPTLCSMQWAEYTSTCQALKLHLCFELNRMIPLDILVGSGNSSERDALRQMLQAGITYIADRGYVSFQLFHDVLEAHAHLIFRMKANLQYQAQTILEVNVPAPARLFLREMTDQLMLCVNDPHQHVYRLVSFQVRQTSFLLLTDRRDLTTFQIIVLYAYRWQVELLFRFLKRSMHGIHLINHSEDGVTIQFYMLLIVALLQLRLKQEVMLQLEQPEQPTQPQPQPEQLEHAAQPEHPEEPEHPEHAAQPEHPEEPEHPEHAAQPQPEQPDASKNVFHNIPVQTDVSHPYSFFRMIGANVQKYWKIGLHWLTTLRNILHHPFDKRTIELLGMI